MWWVYENRMVPRFGFEVVGLFGRLRRIHGLAQVAGRGENDVTQVVLSPCHVVVVDIADLDG